MKIFYISFIAFFVITRLTYCQDRLRGLVTDKDGNPIYGVNIWEKGHKEKGTLTDFDGVYNISILEGKESKINFVLLGYTTRLIGLNESKKGVLNVVLQEGELLEEVVMIGSRSTQRTSTDTPVPVDIVDIKALTKSVPQTTINQILNYVAPSFSSNTQTIADGTDHVDPASLRGLGSDQVLVLINGKRRHSSSLVNINGTFGRGTVGTDLNSIPTASIERIEILRDGAAAQYGSDAISGVINIVLKKDTNKLTSFITTGTYASKNSNNQTGGIDGEDVDMSVNYGLNIGKSGGFINFTGQLNTRNSYNRMKEFEGQIYNRYNAIEWQASKNGYDLSKLDNSIDDIKFFSKQVPYFSQELKNQINKASSIEELNGKKSILLADVTDKELQVRGLKRKDFNNVIGQAKLRGGKFFANMSIPLDEEKKSEIYSFGGISFRNGNSNANYRLPYKGSQVYTPIFINGFLPKMNTNIIDKSIAVGIRGMLNNWNVDFSNTYGQNSFDFFISNTLNASLQNNSPTSFNIGGFVFRQNTVNVDFSQFLDSVLSGLNIAFGSEFRYENYQIHSGDERSYGQYNKDGELIKKAGSELPSDFFGNLRGGGSQAYRAFTPSNAISRERTSIAGYLDLELDINKDFLLSAATRFENYSDFGSTINFKLSSRYKLTKNINLRLAANTGFRAPSLHQLYFNATSVLFRNEKSENTATFTNDSKAARLFGVPKLTQETSKSISLGVTSSIPQANLKISLDAYLIGINDRIVLTDAFIKPNESGQLQEIFTQVGATKALFFANAINTNTKGIDFVFVKKSRLSSTLELKTELSGSIFSTKKIGAVKSSPILKKAGFEKKYFSERNRVLLEEAIPRKKANLTFNLTNNKYNIFLRNTYFGKVTQAVENVLYQQVYSGKVITDLVFTYNFNKFVLSVGSNNIFDIYPDRSRKLWDDGSINKSRAHGRYDWSRISQQFGFAGRYVFARININL